jgi:hypothetical protein
MRPHSLDIVIGGLACFRMAVLISEDSGPMRMFARLRAVLKRESKHHPVLRKTDIAHGIDCLRCSSVWVAFPVGIFLVHQDWFLGHWQTVYGTAWVFLVVMAVSAMAILWHRAFPKR